MDLQGMLNDVPQLAKKTPEQIQKEKRFEEDRRTVLSLLTKTNYVVSKDAMKRKDTFENVYAQKGNNDIQPSPFQQANSTDCAVPVKNIPSATCPRLGRDVAQSSYRWKPKLSLKLVTKERQQFRHNPGTQRRPEAPRDDFVQLECIETVFNARDPKIILEDEYDIQGAYPRGFFVLLAQRDIPHSFVFKYPNRPWFEDLHGLRQSAYIITRTDDGTSWELHLKASVDKKNLFGYLCRPSDRVRIVRDSIGEILVQRKLPLVLDLDDTLVRLVGEGNDRYVPEKDLDKCGDRIRDLGDGKRVVLTERVHEFLDWAQEYYNISVCSLGEQTYVKNVVSVLDPKGSCIRGILYSARSVHDYIKQSSDPNRPPKDLKALYSFCALEDNSLGSGFSLPLILDDETRMWPAEQHDNIIVVKGQENSSVWTVSLFPFVHDTLRHVHQEFFRQLDAWEMGGKYTREPPSAMGIYKTRLRHMLRDQIARDPRLPTPVDK